MEIEDGLDLIAKIPNRYTDKIFFKIPIKCYDVYSMINVEMQEDKQAVANEGMVEPIPIEYLVVEKACRPENIIAYMQSWNKGQDLEEVEKVGLPCTTVTIQEGEEVAAYECIWNIRKFEDKLNERMRAYIA